MRPAPAPIDDRFRERPWHEAGPDPDVPEDLRRRQSITVRGYFRYLRETGPYLGADGATVRVYDADFAMALMSAETFLGQGDARDDALAPPSPNPMEGSTVVAWDLRREAHLRVEIFDARGRRVRRLVDGSLPQGRRELVWDGRDDGCRRVGRGLYLLRATTDGEVQNRKLMVIR